MLILCLKHRNAQEAFCLGFNILFLLLIGGFRSNVEWLHKLTEKLQNAPFDRNNKTLIVTSYWHLQSRVAYEFENQLASLKHWLVSYDFLLVGLDHLAPRWNNSSPLSLDSLDLGGCVSSIMECRHCSVIWRHGVHRLTREWLLAYEKLPTATKTLSGHNWSFVLKKSKPFYTWFLLPVPNCAKHPLIAT